MPRTPLLSSDQVSAAAANNADWCELICRANGVATQRNDRWWSAASRSPALYPDAVTLTPGVEVGELLGTIDNTDGASVKDSYGTLELAGAGFGVLFRAHWIIRPPPAPAGTAGPAWDEVRDPDSLTEWAHAHGIGATLARAVLADPGVVILRRRSAGRTDGGAILNRSATVLGVSNVFGEGGTELWNDVVAAIPSRFRRLPLVGYERGDDLVHCLAAGFEQMGGLSVWQR